MQLDIFMQSENLPILQREKFLVESCQMDNFITKRRVDNEGGSEIGINTVAEFELNIADLKQRFGPSYNFLLCVITVGKKSGFRSQMVCWGFVSILLITAAMLNTPQI